MRSYGRVLIIEQHGVICVVFTEHGSFSILHLQHGSEVFLCDG